MIIYHPKDDQDHLIFKKMIKYHPKKYPQISKKIMYHSKEER